ncbi:hypothetical protein PMAYCL1PPCAC_03853, partial [Pristionchus mayeri]
LCVRLQSTIHPRAPWNRNDARRYCFARERRLLGRGVHGSSHSQDPQQHAAAATTHSDRAPKDAVIFFYFSSPTFRNSRKSLLYFSLCHPILSFS